MRSNPVLAVTAAAATFVLAAGPGPGRAEEPGPKVGDRAPEFRLSASDGREYALSELRGKVVILAWYPKALTSGCTAENNSIRDELVRFRKLDVRIFGASVDPVERNREFAQKNHYEHPLLSDPDKSYARALGVLNAENGMANRWTYIIDGDGVIRAIEKGIRPGVHGRDLLDRLKALGLTPRE